MQPDGKIIKCVSGVGRDEFIIGDYTNGEVGRDNYLFPDLYQKCLEKECPFLPVCHTGCRFDAFIKNKDKKQINCKRELLEEINDELLKINYIKED